MGKLYNVASLINVPNQLRAYTPAGTKKLKELLVNLQRKIILYGEHFTGNDEKIFAVKVIKEMLNDYKKLSNIEGQGYFDTVVRDDIWMFLCVLSMPILTETQLEKIWADTLY